MFSKAVLKAVNQTRQKLKGQKVKCGRGRPSGKVAKRIARKNNRLQAKIKDLFDWQRITIEYDSFRSDHFRHLGSARHLRKLPKLSARANN